MRWSYFLWRLRKGNKATPGQTVPDHIALVNADLFHSIVNCKRPTIFSISTTALHHPGANRRSNRVLNATTVADIPCVYRKYARVLDKVAANKLPKHGPQDHTIDLASTKIPLFELLYNLSTNELQALQDYISDNLAKGFI